MKRSKRTPAAEGGTMGEKYKFHIDCPVVSPASLAVKRLNENWYGLVQGSINFPKF